MPRPAPRPSPYSPGHSAHRTGPKASPRHAWTTRQRHHARSPATIPTADDPTPKAGPRTPSATAPGPIAHEMAPEHTPEALFLHPSPSATGTPRRHQPHKIARSASSAIPRQITSAHPAPVTAPFLRLLRHSPSPSVKPVSTVLPSSRYRFAMSSALISCSPLFCALMVISCWSDI